MFKFTHEKFKFFRYIILILMSYSGIIVNVAEAGEATEVIEEALEAYNKQDLGGAADGTGAAFFDSAGPRASAHGTIASAIGSASAITSCPARHPTEPATGGAGTARLG